MGKISERELSQSLLNAINKSSASQVELITGSLTDLDTKDKSNLVNAINEVIQDTNKSLEGKASNDVVTTSSNGLMSAADKAKLDGVAPNANNYVHPEDANTRHVTDAEKAAWNAKASNATATTSANGLMSKSDKAKLDGIAANANNYIHPTSHPASIIVQDSDNRFVTDEEKAKWNSKASTDIVSASNIGLMSISDKNKLDGIEANANNYTHPSNHPASMITQDANNRFVTDAEKSTWNAKASTATATTGSNGLMSSTDKTKLDGIAAGANNYVHPANHPASMITQDANNRFVTDAEKLKWNDKYTKSEVDNKISEVISSLDWKESVATYNDISTTYPNPVDGWTVNTKDKDETWRYDGEKWVLISANNIPLATTSNDGKMSAADKTKLDGIAVGANNYVHPNDANTRHVTDTEKATWNAKASTAVVSTSVNGLMSSTDKTKLDGIAANANNYTHPANHPASVITQDTNNRFVTDAEKATWNAKASTSVATTGANGLMSAADKAKLDGLANNANNYTHPSTHPATMITQDANNRFVTDAEKSTWNAKASTATATTGANGLMSSADKAKLDGIAAGANKVIVNNTLTSTSTTEALSAAQGKVLNEKINSKSDIIRKDLSGQTIDINTLNLSDGSVQEQFYCEKTTGGAANISNIPVKEPFLLDVRSIRWASVSDYITQQVFTSATTKTTYERFCTNGTWSSWVTNTQFSATPTSGQIVVADGTSGKLKTSGFTIATSVPSGAKFTDTVYTHPANHPASVITQDTNNRFVTDAEKATWNAKASTSVATTTTSGLMSGADKTKLDGIATGANKYVHPANHPASVITQDTNNRFVTDAEKSTWNAKASTATATTGANGLMSATDKAKLDSIAAGANNYVHPAGTNPHGTTKADVGLGNVNNWGATTAVDSTSTTTYATASAVKQAYDLAASKANASHTHNYAGSSSAGGAATSALACTGNSATATKLQTARTINGVSFDGSTNITTANWGTARTITIGNSGKSVNGSGNVSWSLAEIGAFGKQGEVTASTDWNALMTPGVYKVQMSGWGATSLGGPNSFISGIYSYGMVFVYQSNISGETRTVQTYYPHKNDNSSPILTRMYNGTAWNQWSKIGRGLTHSDVGAAAASHTHNYAGSSSAGGAATSALACTGNSATSTKLATARTLTIGSTGKTFDGSANVSWTLDEIGAAAASHTHSYLPLSGGTLTGALAFSNSGTTTRGITGTVGDNDYWRVVGGATASNAGFMEIATADDGNEPIYVRQYTGVFSTVKRTLTLLDGSGNSTFPGKVNTDSVGVKNCSLQYNTTTESLDFIFA